MDPGSAIGLAMVVTVVGVVIPLYLVQRYSRTSCRWGWHHYDHFDGFDGCSARATCRKCGFKGMVDSQGNLF
jgi:hypothetical protein